MDKSKFEDILMTLYKIAAFQKKIQKPIDKRRNLCYNITVVKNNTNQSGV